MTEQVVLGVFYLVGGFKGIDFTGVFVFLIPNKGGNETRNAV